MRWGLLRLRLCLLRQVVALGGEPIPRAVVSHAPWLYRGEFGILRAMVVVSYPFRTLSTVFFQCN